MNVEDILVVDFGVVAEQLNKGDECQYIALAFGEGFGIVVERESPDKITFAISMGDERFYVNCTNQNSELKNIFKELTALHPEYSR